MVAGVLGTSSEESELSVTGFRFLGVVMGAPEAEVVGWNENSADVLEASAVVVGAKENSGEELLLGVSGVDAELAV